MTAGLDWLVPLLVCPVCRGQLLYVPDSGLPHQGLLQHPGCPERFPVIDGVPRLVTGPARPALVSRHAAWFSASPERRAIADGWVGSHALDLQTRIVRDFDYEWHLHAAVRTEETTNLFALYFDLIRPDLFRDDLIALDAGCGMGRWAIEVAARGPRVIAVDLGASVEVARRNAGNDERIACLQADLRELPLREAAVDWGYSLGVLHHVTEPRVALRKVVEAVRPAGTILLYLYYALDDRGPAYRGLFRLVDAVRTLTSRMPRPAVRLFAVAVAAAVYWPLASASRVFAAVGFRAISDALPLSFYRDRTFATMLNDSLDRFGTRLERRYTRGEIVALLEGAGVAHVRISQRPPYWHATAIRERS